MSIKPNELEKPHAFEFRDDRMFCTVLKRHPDIAKELTELVTGRELGAVTYIKDQEVIGYVPDEKSSRLDVFFKCGENTLIDIEMETSVGKKNLEELPKRGQYYASLLAVERAEAGEDYENLEGITVIFICLKDPLGKGCAFYASEMMYDLNGAVSTNAGVKVIYLNSAAADSCESKDLKVLLEYIAGGEPGNELTKKIDDAVREINMEDKWRNAVMAMGMRDRIMKEDGREEGLERGHKEEKRENIRMTYRFYVNKRKPEDQAISEVAEMYGMSTSEIEDILAEPANRVDA